jgi:hypothetical protein
MQFVLRHAGVKHGIAAASVYDPGEIPQGQLNQSLVECTRSFGGIQVKYVSFVHWLWVLDGRPLFSEKDRSERWGRICDLRNQKVLFSSDVTHRRESFANDVVLVKCLPARMKKTKHDAERDVMPDDVVRLQQMWEASLHDDTSHETCDYCANACNGGGAVGMLHPTFRCALCMCRWHRECSRHAGDDSDRVIGEHFADFGGTRRLPIFGVASLCHWCSRLLRCIDGDID